MNLGPLLWLLLIIALIPASLWLLKRSGYGAGPGRAEDQPKLKASLALSAQHRVVVVEVNEGQTCTQLVLGVAPHSIQTLYSFQTGGSFSTQLKAVAPAVAAAAGESNLTHSLSTSQGGTA